MNKPETTTELVFRLRDRLRLEQGRIAHIMDRAASPKFESSHDQQHYNAVACELQAANDEIGKALERIRRLIKFI